MESAEYARLVYAVGRELEIEARKEYLISLELLSRELPKHEYCWLEAKTGLLSTKRLLETKQVKVDGDYLLILDDFDLIETRFQIDRTGTDQYTRMGSNGMNYEYSLLDKTGESKLSVSFGYERGR